MVGVNVSFGNCGATWDVEENIAFVKSNRAFEEVISGPAKIRLLALVSQNR